MLAVGPATRITIHVNQDTSSHKDFLHIEILTFLYERGVSGATVVKPHAGCGSHHRVHTSGAGLVTLTRSILSYVLGEFGCCGLVILRILV
jgi:PII-like signaling protein